jgi:hypothetical protein
VTLSLHQYVKFVNRVITPTRHNTETHNAGIMQSATTMVTPTLGNEGVNAAQCKAEATVESVASQHQEHNSLLSIAGH